MPFHYLLHTSYNIRITHSILLSLSHFNKMKVQKNLKTTSMYFWLISKEIKLELVTKELIIISCWRIYHCMQANCVFPIKMWSTSDHLYWLTQTMCKLLIWSDYKRWTFIQTPKLFILIDTRGTLWCREQNYLRFYFWM